MCVCANQIAPAGAAARTTGHNLSARTLAASVAAASVAAATASAPVLGMSDKPAASDEAISVVGDVLSELGVDAVRSAAASNEAASEGDPQLPSSA